jgi:hypothetical protein
MSDGIDLMKAAMKELDENLTVTEEKVQHFLAGQTAHTTHLMAIEALLIAIIKHHPINFGDAKAPLLAKGEPGRSALDLVFQIEQEVHLR